MEEKENCCGEAEVTVAEVFLKIAYGATGSSAREAVLNNGSHPSGLRLLLSPKRLKSWPLRGGSHMSQSALDRWKGRRDRM